MYILRFLDSFNSTYSAIVKGDHEKEKRAKKALSFLRQEPLESDGVVGLAEIYELFGILIRKKK